MVAGAADDAGGAGAVAGSATYDPRWFDLLDRVEDRHFWFAARRQVVGRLARRALAGVSGPPRVLEIGCGNGGLLATLQAAAPGGVVVGTDLYLDALHHARLRSSAHLVCADLQRSPFGAPFDLIGMFDVLEHLDDDAGVLRAVAGMLAPGG